MLHLLEEHDCALDLPLDKKVKLISVYRLFPLGPHGRLIDVLGFLLYVLSFSAQCGQLLLKLLRISSGM